MTDFWDVHGEPYPFNNHSLQCLDDDDELPYGVAPVFRHRDRDAVFAAGLAETERLVAETTAAQRAVPSALLMSDHADAALLITRTRLFP